MPKIMTFRTCPNCGEDWSLDEVREQACDSCDFPYHDSKEQHEFDPDYIGPDETKLASHEQE